MKADTSRDLLRRGIPTAELTLLNPTTDPQAPSEIAARGMVQLANKLVTEARTSLRLAVALGDSTPVTVLNLALAEVQAGDRDRGLELMREMERCAPGWDEPPLRLAETLRAADRNSEAEVAYQRALDLNPRRDAALLGLAGLLIMRGQGQQAQSLLLRCCGIAPERADAWDALGLALLLTRDNQLAESAFAEAQRLSPRALLYARHRVDAAMAAGSHEALLAVLEVSHADDPLNPVPVAALGILLGRLGRRGDSVDAMEAAYALAPDSAVLAALFAEYLTRANRFSEAETILRRASELDPDNGQYRDAHASIMLRLYRHAEARHELLASIERNGERPGELCNLSNATSCLGLQEESVELARRAVSLAPESGWVRRSLCNALPYRDGITGTELLRALKDCSARLPRHTLPPLTTNNPDPDRPLLIGLLSGSFKAHPVGWLTVAGLETLDPATFQIICLAQNAAQDWMARRFRSLACAWHDVDGLNDVALAMKARELEIDVLIDMGGYGQGGRMTACAHRLAPVQIKWVGMQNHSSGLAEMDWIITDRWETPSELAHVYSERPLCLPDGYVCYSPPPYAPDVSLLPALTNGHITFGCFNNLAKITPRVIATWSTILHGVPDSRLVLKTHQFGVVETVERVRKVFRDHGIAANRIELRGPSGHRAFLREYNDVDIVLDPFPYSGGLTTCEALWMGVPTVTVPGEIFASRHSMSHLSNAGLTDWVAPDLPAYVELAVAKAKDLDALATLRSRLRGQVRVSPLCDAPRFGRNLGEALRYAWSEWCDKADRRLRR
jgi:protein O-GlcNAc transferase